MMSDRFGRKRFATLAATVAFCTFALVGARADVIVIQSSAPSLKSGQTIKGNGKIIVPSGKSAVLMLPNGSTKTLSGPFEGTAASLTKGLNRNAALLDSVTNYIRTGGANTSNVGATRGIAPPQRQGGAAAHSGSFSWREVPVEASGDICVEKGAPITLTRGNTQASEDITIVDMKSAKRAVVSFASGVGVADWPADIDPANGGVAVLAPRQKMKRLRMHLIDKVPAADETVKVLYAQRCVSQMQAYLAGLTK